MIESYLVYRCENYRVCKDGVDYIVSYEFDHISCASETRVVVENTNTVVTDMELIEELCDATGK